MKIQYQQESDKQMEMAWVKMDKEVTFFITTAQYDETVQDAFIATCRVVLNQPLNELGGAQ